MRGGLGEVILGHVAGKYLGLQKGEYFVQEYLKDESGDFLIKLTGERRISILLYGFLIKKKLLLIL